MKTSTSAGKRKNENTDAKPRQRKKTILQIIPGPVPALDDTAEISVVDENTGSPEDDTKCQIRFTSEMDLDLLREVAVSKPFTGAYKEIPKNWEKAYDSLGWPKGNVKSMRKRFEYLKKKHCADDAAALRSSGTEEDYDEKKQLLTDIMEALGSIEKEKEVKSEAEKASVEAKAVDCEAIRAAALTGLVKREESKERIRNKAATGDLAEIFKQKNLKEQEHMEKQLDFDKEKFNQTLDQQEKDRQERAKDRELEHRRLDVQEKAMTNQQTIMIEMLKRFSK